MVTRTHKSRPYRYRAIPSFYEIPSREACVFMRKQVGILVAGLFYYSGLVGVSRWLMQRAGKRLIILNYHHASGGDLRRHMVYLRRHYRVLHLEEALEELYQPCAAQNASKD